MSRTASLATALRAGRRTVRPARAVSTAAPSTWIRITRSATTAVGGQWVYGWEVVRPCGTDATPHDWQRDASLPTSGDANTAVNGFEAGNTTAVVAATTDWTATLVPIKAGACVPATLRSVDVAGTPQLRAEFSVPNDVSVECET